MPHHFNWWAIALVVSTLARNGLTYMPVPASAPGFISSPWYPVIYHFIQGVLALNPASSADMLKNLNQPNLNQGVLVVALNPKKENQL
jgi:hypothetical protein